MKQYSAENIRNLAVAGHSGAGKTSLCEALLYFAGATDRLGKIVDGNTVCDYDAEAIRRKASVSSALAPLEYQNTKVNLLDTPGLFDFAGGMYEGISAAEAVLITVSGRGGMTVGAEKAYKLAKAMHKSFLFAVPQMDVENANFDKAFEEIRAYCGSGVCPLVVPVMENHVAVAYVDVLANKAYKYEKNKAVEIPVPSSVDLETIRMEISEAVAETDDELMEKFFSGEEFTDEELISGVKNGVEQGVLTPVFACSSTTLGGIDLLLSAIVNLLPSPASHNGGKFESKDGEIACSAADPFAAFVFKTIADPFVGKMSFVKVVSGKLTPDLQPVNSRTASPERLGKLLFVKGKKQEDAQVVEAGDICVISKLAVTGTGDSLYDPKRPVSFPEIKFPNPTLSMAVTAKSKGDEGKISQGLQRLIEEDPTVKFEINAETKEQILTGLGEQHLDVIVSKLKNKFGTEVALEKPTCPYRETIRKKAANIEGKHKKQTGGHGQFGRIIVDMEPYDGEDLLFEEKVFGGSVPKNFFPAIEKGFRDCIKHGTIAGYPVVGLHVTLLDGSYHPVDSSEMAFKIAASLAFKAGMAAASPCLLEPVYSVKVLVPDDCAGDIMSDFNKRRGRVMGMNPSEDEKGMQVIEAEAPLAEMSDFTTSLRSIAQGRGSFEMKFERYEQLPQNLEAAVIEASKNKVDEE